MLNRMAVKAGRQTAFANVSSWVWDAEVVIAGCAAAGDGGKIGKWEMCIGEWIVGRGDQGRSEDG